jgi:hypothetical protein
MLAASSGHGESHSWNACTAMHEPANRKTIPLFRISIKNANAKAGNYQQYSLIK